jgi:predicted DNA-binding antitoxin AbrB/MazE fold protein
MEPAMELSIDATYEDGVLKPAAPLPLAEHERVRIMVQPQKNWAQRTAGMLKWTGHPKLLERLISDPDLDPQESA